MSVLFVTHKMLQYYGHGEVVPLSDHVRREFVAARRLLPMCYGDLHRLILPFVCAQDAEGINGINFGGFGIGCAQPQGEQIVQLALEALAQVVPSESDLAVGQLDRCGVKRLSDLRVLDGALAWHNVWPRITIIRNT